MRRTTTLPALLVVATLLGSWLLGLGPAHAQPTLLHSIDGVGANGLLGSSIAISGNRVVVGSGPGQPPRVYEVENDRLVLRATLTTPAGGTPSFGQQVAIDGDRLFVCDTNYDSENGAIFAYRPTADGTWTLRQTIQTTERSNGQFCIAGMERHGDLMVASAFYFDRFSDRMGRVFVFRLGADDMWRQVLTVAPPMTSSGCGECQFFGIALAFDGRRLATSDLSRNTTYVWDLVVTSSSVALGVMRPYPGATWRPGRWGKALALAGPNVVVASDATVDGVANAGAIDFLADDGTATAATRTDVHDAPAPHGVNDLYGARLARSGEYLAAAGTGFVYLHRRGLDGRWTASARMTPTSGATNTLFGSSVAIDGDLMVVGESGYDTPGTNAGRVHLYRVPVQQFVTEELELPRLPAVPSTEVGTDGALDRAEGTAIVLDETGTNAYTFDVRRRTAELVQTIPHVHPATEFYGRYGLLTGSTIAIADVGVRDGRGDISIYRRTSDGTYTYDTTLTSGVDRTGLWGFELAGHANQLVVGAPYYSTGGFVTLLSRTAPDTAYSPTASVDSPDAGGLFGFGLDVDGDTVAVGCIESNCPGAPNGSVYVFRVVGSTLVREALLIPPAITSSGRAQCGVSLALSGDVLAIGCRLDSAFGLRNGAVFLYERNGTTWSARPTRVIRPGSRRDDLSLGASVRSDGTVVVASERLDDTFASRVRAFIGGVEVMRYTLSTGTSAVVHQVDGNLALVGAPTTTIGGAPHSGRAFVVRLGYPAGALCDADEQCFDGRCEGWTCAAATPAGGSCTTDDACASGYCVDGVCCDGACDGACEACSAAGECEPIEEGMDPMSECADDFCGAVSCNGAGACAAPVMCDAGGPFDAGTDAASEARDVGASDAAGARDDAALPPGVDGGAADAAGAADDTGGGPNVARVPLSCTCTAAGSERSGSSGAAIFGLAALGLAIAARRRTIARGLVRTIVLSLVLATFFGAPASVTHAQATAPATDEAEAQREARARFELGHAHYDAGRYVEAAAEFERAYALTHRPGLLYNLHLSYQFAGNMPEATRTLRLYLETATDIEASVRRALERRLASAEAALAAQTPTQPAPTEPAEPTEPVEPALLDPPTPDEEVDPVITPPTTGTDDTAGAGLGLEPGVAVMAVGAATLIGAAVTGALALGAQSERDGMCTAGVSMTECPATYDQQSVVGRFTTMRDTAWALGIVGGLAFAAGTVLLVIGATDDAPPVTPQAACGPDGCVAGVSGHF